jgi:hypothetical protein
VNYGGEEITHPKILKAFNNDYPEIKVTTSCPMPSGSPGATTA